MRTKIFFLGFALFFFASLQAQICTKTQLPANLQSGLVAFYPFCGNANDASGNGHNGTVNGAALTTDRFGNVNSAYSFDGISAYIAANALPEIIVNFSFSVWTKNRRTIGSGPSYGCILTTQNSASQGFILQDNSSRNMDFALPNGSGYSDLWADIEAALNEWEHYVCTYDGSVMKMYKNGVLIASRTAVTNLAKSTAPLYIGLRYLTSTEYFKGEIDDIIIYNKVLNNCEVSQVFNATNQNIPQQNFTINPLTDTIKVCGPSTVLDAGSGYSSYAWNTGATTQTISASTSGWYKVTITNSSGCSASDSTYLSIVKANIIQSDTIICKGASIKLNIDSTFSSSTSCSASTLPADLRSGLVAYFPFCGNANDVTGNGNNGVIFGGAQLTTDRFGNPNSAYNFNGTNQYIQSASLSKSITNKTYAAWVKLSTLNQSAGGLVGIQSSNGQIFDVTVYNETNNGWGFGSDNLTRSYWSGVKETASEWAMITATYEQNSYKIYRNGILIGSTTQFGITNFGTTAKINIGYRHTGGGSPYLNALIDDVYIYDRVLSPQEISMLYKSTSVSWSTGASSNSITVTPTQTTKYFVTVTDGITSCQDSITVTVSDLSTYNPLQDTTRVCGDSVILDAGSGYASYNWSNGATTQKITAKSSGKYVVNVSTASGCSASDSSLVSILKAKILQKDTTICKGSTITLSIDSSFAGTATACNTLQLPATLRNGLVAYYPFCGNANDASGNGNNGIVYGATLVNDRNGNPLSAFNFNGSSNFIEVLHSSSLSFPSSNQTISFWINLPLIPNPQGNDMAIISKTNQNLGIDITGNSNLGFEIGFEQSPLNNLSNRFKNGATSTWGKTIIPNTQFTINKWYNITFVINKDKDSAFAFLNGNLIDSKTLNSSTSIGQNTLALWIGRGYWMSNGIPSNYFNGSLDDIFIYDRVLSQNEIYQLQQVTNVTWSNNATKNSITVTPTQTTKYYVTVSDGITSCQDSITVTVSDIGTFNPLEDTTRVCGDSITLDAGSGYTSYNWSNGATTQKIIAKSSGKYTVTVANASGCTASDSSLVSIVKAKILQRDTTICKGASLILNTDSTRNYRTACNLTEIQTNLRNGLLGYWPFCNNLNDASGNGRNATNYGALLAKDRFGNSGNAMGFNLSALTGQYITVPGINVNGAGSTGMSLSLWYKRLPLSSNISTLFRQEGSCNFPDFLIQSRNTGIETGVRTSSYSSSFSNYTIDTNWHMISFTYDKSQLKTYLDGNLIGTQSKTGAVSFLENTSYIGICGSLTDHPFSGYIDDIGIWNRALSASEITAMVNGTQSDQLQRQWSTGATTNSINVNPTQTTKYYVTVSDGITTCKDSVTVTVAQLDTAITALDPTSVCSTGGTVRLQAGVATTYQWLRDGAVITGATARLFSASQTGSYRVVVTNAAGCSDTSRTINIVLDPKPVPNFTINNNAQCLTENAFNFTNTSTISAGTLTYSWTLGDATTATSTDASRTYTSAGTYNIKLVATSNRQCTDSITKTITVFDQPAIPTITGPDEFCSGATITLNTNAPATRQWYRNNALIAGATGASYTLQQPGDYKVSTQNSNGCVSFSNTKTITENPLPQGEITTPVSLFICEGTPYTLSATGGSSYQWFRNNVAIAGETSATLVTGLPGNYKAEIVSDKGCRAMGINNFDLTLIKAPDASFSYDTYCVNVQTNFSSRSTTNQSGTVTYAWKFGDGKSAGNTTNTFNTYLNAGNYTATLIVTPTACPQLADSSNAVLAIQAPTPGIQYPPVNVIINKDQQLSARNIGIGYLWTPGTFLNSITSRTPTVNANKEQLYRIIISNLAGCTTVDTQLVRVFPDKNIYVPEGFTPDNDGRNDRLYPIPVGIREMKVFRIYNRWGLLVYDNKNANANTGWDGTYKGTRQPMETFAWVAEGIDIDGVLIRRTGNTILIR